MCSFSQSFIKKRKHPNLFRDFLKLFSKRKGLLLCLLLSSCCYYENPNNIDAVAEKHAEKLRMHFSGHVTQDISSLISETRAISARLKIANRRYMANKFDSYIDVLTYGNRTIDESLNDVLRLVKHEECICLPLW